MSESRRTARSPISSDSTVDYVAVAIAFAEDAIADTRRCRHGEWIRLAARRFIADLRRSQRKRPPYLFSPGRANHACRFIEQLPHVEGQWSTPLIKLEPFQVWFIVSLFGFRNLDGGRRFTVALLTIARKNAKSTLAAAVMLYIFCCEPEQGAQIFSAATTGAQARIVWNVARQMVQRLPQLQRTFDLETFANAIARYETGGTFRPINARASSQDGLNPSAICLDELHAHRTHDLRNVLMSAAGARRNPLFVFTTTEGYESPGPWAEERSFAHSVLRRVVKADHYFAAIFSVDDGDDDFDPTCWVKANPLMSANPQLLAAIKRDALEAKAKPGTAAEFRIKRLNRRAETARGWINLHRWRMCAGRVDVESLIGSPCWAALDLASTTDLTAWRLLWLRDGVYYTTGRFWVPQDAVAQRTARGSVPYASWIEAGHIEQTAGSVTDYAVIESHILSDFERFSPQGIAFDEWNAGYLVTRLIDAGLPMTRFVQGARSYNPAMRALEHAYMERNLRHGGDPVLTWNAANLVAVTDSNLNMRPDRKRSADKIDGLTALLMCVGLAEASAGGDVAGFLANPIIA